MSIEALFGGHVVQRRQHHEEDAVRQAKADEAMAASTSGSDGNGQRMPEHVQAKMERAFRADFTDVRIHEGNQAKALNALAYTQGTDIHFAPGHYQPDTRQGQELLGHELTHVVQQRQGRVAATTQTKRISINNDRALEIEADEMGARAARADSAASSVGPMVGAQGISRAPVVQGKCDACEVKEGAKPMSPQQAKLGKATHPKVEEAARKLAAILVDSKETEAGEKTADLQDRKGDCLECDGQAAPIQAREQRGSDAASGFHVVQRKSGVIQLHTAAECEEWYEECNEGCRRLPNRTKADKARRALCWSTCMAQYAACLATATETLTFAAIVAAIVLASADGPLPFGDAAAAALLISLGILPD
jgi:hypothetical protein